MLITQTLFKSAVLPLASRYDSGTHPSAQLGLGHLDTSQIPANYVNVSVLIKFSQKTSILPSLS